MIDPVALALSLVRFETVSPPGSEAACARHLAQLLTSAGVPVGLHAFAPDRLSLVARAPGQEAGLAPLAFTGHLDTVPLGTAAWTRDPGGEIRDGRLYGRGASDMKAGVAAFVAAVLGRIATAPPLRRGVLLVITAGEETGCLGASFLAREALLGPASGLIVAEPTANRLGVAHKGALHLRARTRGATAHGSMPELGDNAVLKATAAVERLRGLPFAESPHPLLGSPTLAVTSLHGGEAANVIPDACTFTLDLRTLPGQPHPGLLRRLAERAGPDVTFDPPLVDLPGVGTDPHDPFAVAIGQVLAQRGANPSPIGLPYFTDGSVLQGALGDCPTVILGPGDPGQAHQTDEWCSVEAIAAASGIFAGAIEAWCG